MKTLIAFSRVFVGGLFVISGLIKANDPLGFSYKLGEYFEESALNLPFLEDYALLLASLACLAEVVLGFAVIFGGKMKLATWALVLLTVFFGWLTLYTATCDPQGTYTIMVDGIEETRGVTCVTDCGCFGDALKGSLGRSLTPWESFYKDLILFIFIIPMFLWRGKIDLNTAKDDRFLLPAALIFIAFLSWVFNWYFPILFTLFIYAGYLLIKKYRESADWLIAGFVAVLTIVFIWYGIQYLPIRDYRPYAVNESIPEQMKSAEELGLEPPEYVYHYTMVHNETGEELSISDKEYMSDRWWEKKEYTLDKEKTKGPFKVKDGYEPKISDFSMTDEEGSDASYLLLESEQPVLIVVNYDVEKITGNMDRVSALAQSFIDQGAKVYGLSASSSELIEKTRHEYQLAFPYLQGDEKVLKTIVRSNPGIVLLDRGVVKGKWSSASIPDITKLNEALGR